MAGPGGTVQVVNGDGVFQVEPVQRFVEAEGLPECKRDYQVVAIMGPQSSGKSTLLNHVVRRRGGTRLVPPHGRGGNEQRPATPCMWTLGAVVPGGR